ncbi:MAG TPA: hypothetical protein VHL52_03830 [Acidimicrobiia bacterium]|nr:hypothetical protein [Acidimicrobiia bacterium]
MSGEEEVEAAFSLGGMLGPRQLKRGQGGAHNRDAAVKHRFTKRKVLEVVDH